MKKFLPVLLALCLGVAPVFGQDVQVAVEESESAESALIEAESLEIAAQAVSREVSAAPILMAEEQAPLFGSDVPQLSVLRVFGGMGLVLCLLVGAYFGLRKLAPGYFPKTVSGGKNLKIVESIGMGDRRSIALVEVGGKRFLIGSTPQQINLLTTLPEHFSLVAEEDEVNVAQAANNLKEEGERHIFRNLFEAKRKRSNPGHPEKVLPEEVRQKMRRLREALENR